MKTTVFDEWIIECDEWITASAYSKISCGSAQECGCDDCQLFVKLCPSIFPRRVRDLLEGLGIDLKKEKEVSEFGFGRARPGMNLYIAEYDFYGKLVAGPDAMEPQGSGFTINLRDIEEGAQLGFTERSSYPRQMPFRNLCPLTSAILSVWVPVETNLGLRSALRRIGRIAARFAQPLKRGLRLR
ncbi:MAG: hypothetical protein DMF33_10235 [Verrucomicrobia bacterium]|nr:MAG: hypothetical protein DMF33_10235 [Verrucomicrobiota bacterium]